jgi:hypothetical protein
MINWAEMNPFARADRQQTGEPPGKKATELQMIQMLIQMQIQIK